MADGSKLMLSLSHILAKCTAISFLVGGTILNV
jgi:hypothetical protein